jgi:ribosomal protein S18 acetylase RimI-like enzyme
MQIRQYRASDYVDVVGLWTDCGVETSLGDEAEDLANLLHPQLFIVGAEDGALVATLLATFDGRRGWLHHLAVAPAYRHRGRATELVLDMERRLRALGCRKVNLLIEPGNAGVERFYRTVGYSRDSLLFMERRLEGDVGWGHARS